MYLIQGHPRKFLTEIYFKIKNNSWRDIKSVQHFNRLRIHLFGKVWMFCRVSVLYPLNNNEDAVLENQ